MSEAEDLVVSVLGALSERRLDDFAAGFTEDAEIRYPQSGERFVGRESIRAMATAFPSPPRFTVERIRSLDELVVAEAEVDYGTGEPWKAVVLYTLRDGLIASETAYFGAPFEPAEWRAPFRAS